MSKDSNGGKIGRQPKLTKEKVRKIRTIGASSGLSYAKLARKYGTSRQVIQGILSGRTYANVT